MRRAEERENPSIHAIGRLYMRKNLDTYDGT